MMGIAALVYWGSDGKRLMVEIERPFTPLSQARVGDLVRVRAAAHPGPRGPERSPLSDRACVFYAIHAHVVGRTTRFALERLERDFYVTDGTTYALIDAAGMKVYSGQPHLWVERGNVLAGATLEGRLNPQQLAFVHARLGRPRDVSTVQESRIEPADVIEVIGVLGSMTGPAGNGFTFLPGRRGAVRVVIGGLAAVRAAMAMERAVALGLGGLGLFIMTGAVAYGFFG